MSKELQAGHFIGEASKARLQEAGIGKVRKRVTVIQIPDALFEQAKRIW